MVSLNDLLEILKFQLRRDNYFLMKLSLELLEKDRDSGLKLERILKNLGFEDKEFFQSEENFRVSRKKVLDEFNNKVKEIDDLINKFNIQIDKKEK